jgi:hypothetical protein
MQWIKNAWKNTAVSVKKPTNIFAAARPEKP